MIAARVASATADTADGQGAKPQDHDRAEDLAHSIRAVALQQEQPDQHRHRHRNDVGLQLGHDDFEALHRTEHRDRRRDHAVTVKQPGTGHPEQQPRSAQRRSVGDRLRCQRGERGERDDAAFAVVVGTQDQDHLLQRRHQHQGPEDDRHDADDADGLQRPGSPTRLRRPRSLRRPQSLRFARSQPCAMIAAGFDARRGQVARWQA